MEINGIDNLLKVIEAACEFFPLIKLFKAEKLSGGNINDTYKISLSNGENYILQRINESVFKDVDSLMENISSVTKFYKKSLKEKGLSDKRKIADIVQTNFGTNYVRLPHGFYRMYTEISNAVSYDTVSDLKMIYGAGEAFGNFQLMLNGFPKGKLVETIPDFHNTKNRYIRFENNLKYADKARFSGVIEEIDNVMSYRKRAELLSELYENGSLPMRVTHNDTKCNNVMFDKSTGEPLGVVDLDTVMEGLIAYDFGDGARSISSTADENETNFELIKFDLNKFEAFASGFLSKTASILSSFEKESLFLGIFTLTAELALRFLEDYLDGDKYFKVQFDKHNLVRAKNQLFLLKDVVAKEEEIKTIIGKYV